MRHFALSVPFGPTGVREEPTQATTNSFRIAWDYDAARSRVTQWTVRHAEVGGAWTERPLINPDAREYDFTFRISDSGKTYSIEIIANSDGTTSTDIEPMEVTLSEYMVVLVGNSLNP